MAAFWALARPDLTIMGMTTKPCLEAQDCLMIVAAREACMWGLHACLHCVMEW